MTNENPSQSRVSWLEREAKQTDSNRDLSLSGPLVLDCFVDSNNQDWGYLEFGSRGEDLGYVVLPEGENDHANATLTRILALSLELFDGKRSSAKRGTLYDAMKAKAAELVEEQVSDRQLRFRASTEPQYAEAPGNDRSWIYQVAVLRQGDVFVVGYQRKNESDVPADRRVFGTDPVVLGQLRIADRSLVGHMREAMLSNQVYQNLFLGDFPHELYTTQALRDLKV